MSRRDAQDAARGVSNVQELKSAKRRVKTLRGAATSATFATAAAAPAAAAAAAPEHHSQTAENASRKRKRLQAGRNAAAAAAAAEDAAGAAGADAAAAPRPLTEFIARMGEQRAKSRQQADGAHAAAAAARKQPAKKRRKGEGRPRKGLLSRIHSLGETSPAGGALIGTESNLLECLQESSVADRWVLMDRPLLPEAARQRGITFMHEFVREGMPTIPPEYMRKLQNVKGAFGKDDFLRLDGGSAAPEQIEGAVSKVYIQDFLRSPDPRKAGERQCVNGEACQGNLMWQRSFAHSYVGAEEAPANKALREFLLPSEQAELEGTGQLRQEVKFCVVCERYVASMLAKFRSTRNADLSAAMDSGLLCSHSVIVDEEGEYSSSCCMYCVTPSESPAATLIPEHSDVRYIYEFGRGHAGQVSTRLREVGVSYERPAGAAAAPAKQRHLN